MTATRLEDWPERLNRFLEQPHKFDWQTANCALFAADAVEAMTGIDFAEQYRGPKTKLGVYRRLLKRCGGGVEDAATKELGQPKPILLAQRGDVVSAAAGENGEIALGVCAGQWGVFLSLNPKLGVVHISLSKCLNAWTV